MGNLVGPAALREDDHIRVKKFARLGARSFWNDGGADAWIGVPLRVVAIWGDEDDEPGRIACEAVDPETAPENSVILYGDDEYEWVPKWETSSS